MSYSIERLMDNINTGRNKHVQSNVDPCAICSKKVKTDHLGIKCDSCDLWVHIVCNGTSEDEYVLLKNKNDLWHCLYCNLKNNLFNFPFTTCDNLQLSHINNCNSMHFLESLPDINIVNETVKFSNLASNEINNELPCNSSCKYYSINEYQKLNCSNNLNILHSNIKI